MQTLPPFPVFNPEVTFRPPVVLDDVPRRLSLLANHFLVQCDFLRSHYEDQTEARTQIAIRAEQALNDLTQLQSSAGEVSENLAAQFNQCERFIKAHLAPPSTKE